MWKSWGKVAARANPVLDNELLTKSLRQPLTNKTCKQIGPAPRRKSDYQPHWPRRIGLRLCDARGRQRGSARYQLQKLTARNLFDGVPPLTAPKLFRRASDRPVMVAYGP